MPAWPPRLRRTTAKYLYEDEEENGVSMRLLRCTYG
jgi:hypothetical protein